MESAAIQDAVMLLMAARGDHRRLEAFPPACRPATLEEGYAIQEAFTAAWAAPVAGYKIGCVSPETQKVMGTTRPFLGRVFAPTLLRSPAQVPAKAFHIRGMEPEFAFTMARDLPSRAAPYRRDEVADAVAAIHAALEIIDTRWTDWFKVGVASVVADNGANGALVLGPACADWRAIDLPAARGVLRFDGKTIAEGTGSAVMGNPLDALVWAANDLSQRGFGLKAGDAVTTGTLAHVHFAEPGTHVVLDCGPIGTAEVTFLK